MAYYKPKKGQRDGVPAITVPRTLTQHTYFNVPLAMMLQERGIEKLSYTLNREDKEIVLRKPEEGEKGYKVLRTGKRGFGITPRFRKILPAGRYKLTSTRRNARNLVFAKA